MYRKLWKAGHRLSFPKIAPGTQHDADQAIADEDDPRLTIQETEDPDLRVLNEALTVLSDIFPNVQPEVFREMLLNLDGESRTEVTAEAILKHGAETVRGRWRTQNRALEDGRNTSVREEPGALRQEEQFRSKEYRSAVRTLLRREFRVISRSVMEAVLAEHNQSYSAARPTLVMLSSKSWRVSVSSFFLGKKSETGIRLESHPLITWEISTDGVARPCLKETKSAELNRELYELLIQPHRDHEKRESLNSDYAKALEMNEEESRSHESLLDCECCFASYPFEQLTACDKGSHFVCYHCVRHSLQEALYGQGWSRSVNAERSTINCLALDSEGGCGGVIPPGMVKLALSSEETSHDTWRHFQERMAEEELRQLDKSLVQCPFCSYAELDEICPPQEAQQWSTKLRGRIWTSLLLAMAFLLLSILFAIQQIQQHIVYDPSQKRAIWPSWTESLNRLARKSRGLRFCCQSPQCGRQSCVVCHKEWRDIHVCYESERLALRAHVERAMAEAVKRTCPICNLSFVKASGCNKLVCNCGYKMCYVCRKDIRDEGYQHFCQHFRPLGSGACQECNKCDLYRCEDEDIAISKAAREAEEEWRATQLAPNNKSLTWSWESRDDLSRGYGELQKSASRRRAGVWEQLYRAWKGRRWQDVLDTGVEHFIVLRT